MNLFTRLFGALSLALILASPARADQSLLYSDPTVATSGLTLMNNYNSAFLALSSCNSGNSAPSNLQAGNVAGVCWADTSLAGFIIVKQWDGAAWAERYRLDTSNHVVIVPLGTGIGSIVANGTTDLCTVPQSSVTITGTNTISSFGSSCLQPGSLKVIKFAAAAVLTYNATSLIIPGQTNITVAAGDTALAQYLGFGNWLVAMYQPASGSALKNPAVPVCSKIDYMGFSANLPAGYVLATGQAINRASFPEYLACSTLTQSGTLTNGSLIVTGLASTAEYSVGMPIEHPNIPAGATIASINSGTQITLNVGHAATANGAFPITAFAYGYGSGGSSSTVGLPNCAGFKIAGRDPSGAQLSAFSGLNVTKGAELHTMTVSELVSHNHGITDPGHIHGITDPGHAHQAYQPTQTRNDGTSVQSFFAFAALQNTTTNVTGITINNHTTGITVNSNGSSAPFTVLDPSLSSNCAVRVLP